MLDLKRIREQTDEVRKGLAAKKQDPAALDRVLALDVDRRAVLTETDALKNRRNTVSKEIGNLKKQGKNTDEIQADMRTLGDQIAANDAKVKTIDEQLDALVLALPNLPHSSVAPGKTSADNVVHSSWGKAPEFSFKPKNHIEIVEHLGIVDFARGAKLSGSGFPLFVGQGAQLVRALINFLLDIHTREHGYTEVWPPVVVNADSMTGTGQLPKMAEDMYHCPADGLYLIPTAEVPVTNIYRDEILDRPLPILLTAYTPCFRREAGAAGKETRGLIRVHQFDKVEMVKFVDPATSYDELESLRRNAEVILERLDLSYRVLALCTGDLSFAAAKCYDIELWAPGQNEWLEVSSCSNFEDFQARRAKIRYRDAEGKPKFVHTLNGSGVALPRLIVAILENFQQADGSVTIPEALVPYMGGRKALTKG